MLDHHSSHESRPEIGREKPREKTPERRVTDREVPVKKQRRNTPAVVHAWLDGDLPEAAAKRGDTVRDVDFWHRIEKDVDKRRQMRTPVHVYQQIMDSLPQTTPRVITPWWRRPLVVTPTVALATAAGLLAVGMAVGATMLMR